MVYTVRREGKLLDIPVVYNETLKDGVTLTTGIQLEDFMVFDNGLDPHSIIHFSENLSGDSAGLMVTLELIQELKGTDLTKGYKVAGTGTIDVAGRVGEIGAMDLKIITADQHHVDIFFVPKSHNENEKNEQEAKDAAKKIGTSMKVVPVESVDEALQYLAGLPVKSTT